MDFDQQLEQLNAQQLAAVVTDDAPLRIIAGAGSGKTAVITMKIAYLIKKRQLKSWRILAMTFTNKAAQEMRNRVQSILDDPKANPLISTFHSFCYRILRENPIEANLQPNFTIIDASEQKILIKRLVKTFGLESSRANKLEKTALWKIEKYKNEFLSPEDILNDENYLQMEEDRQVAKVYQTYEQTLKENNYVDFNDLLLKAYALLKSYPEILEKWINRFDYLLVDEFQDTNNLQFELVKLLTNNRNCLTVVGDPDQTIYSWRGARIDIILNFQKTYPQAKTIVLDQNYRSTKQILDLANDAISHNKNREKKNLVTQSSGNKVIIHPALTRYDEANFVAEKIQEYVSQKKYEYRDFFVIYRINAWSQEFEKVFDNKKIPFQLVGGFRFRERKVIKDAIAYLRAISLKDNLAVERVLTNTPKIGAVTIEKLRDFAQQNEFSLYDALVNHQDEVVKLSKYLPEIGKLLISGNQKVSDNNFAYDVMKFILTESGFEERLMNLAKNDDDEQNLQVLYDQLKQFDQNFDAELYGQPNRVLAFLQEEALGAEEDDSQLPNRVTLLTIHAAKGLENKVVFLVGNNRDVFPSKRSSFDSKGLEEERRALYVGMTRAKQELFITYVDGEYSFISQEPLTISKFIKELDQDLYELQTDHLTDLPISKTTDYSESLSRKDEIESEIESGDLVEHSLFGTGIVIKRIENQFRIAFTDPKYGIMLIDVNNPALSKK